MRKFAAMKRFLLFAFAVLSLHVFSQNLSGIQVDNLSDAQIKNILAQGQAQGLTTENGEAMALSMGLPPAEAKKFNARVEQLQGKSANSASSTNPTGTLAATTSIETEVDESQEVKSAVTKTISGSKVAEGNKAAPVTIYGQALFRKGNLQVFERSLDAKAPNNYIVGEGDEIAVSVAGSAYFNETYVVDSRGRIAMNKMGSIMLRGMTFKQAQRLIKASLRPHFNMKSNEITINLSYSRTITVNIVGEVLTPGSFKLPAINTAFNALIAAGGPSNIGTLRNIQVRRHGKVVKTLDVYQYLMHPDSHEDFFLQDNDYLFVGLSNNITTITGEVRRPMAYELLPHESVMDLINYAGGLKPQAFTDRVQLKHMTNESITLSDIEQADFPATMLHMGDAVNVYTKNLDVINYVNITGAVMQPGTYNFNEKMTANDLIALAGGLHPHAIIDELFISRELADRSRDMITFSLDSLSSSPVLENQDRLILTFKPDLDARYSVLISGAVMNPGKFGFSAGMTANDLIALAGGLHPDAMVRNAFIQREADDLSSNLLTFSLDEAGSSPVLQDNDKLIITLKPAIEEGFMVAVSGAVRSAQTIPFAQGMTLGDALLMSGGLLPNADYEHIEISRLKAFESYKDGALRDASTEVMVVAIAGSAYRNDFDAESDDNLSIELNPYDQIIVRSIPDFHLQQMVTISGEVEYPGAYPLLHRDERIASVIERAGGVTDYADVDNASLTRAGAPNVATRLAKAIKRPNRRYDYILVPGDVVSVPMTTSFVTITGQGHEYFQTSQMASLTAPVIGKSKANDYINHFAQGFAKRAHRAKLYVSYPNGNMSRTVNYGLFLKYPRVKSGGTIHINLKPEKEKRKDRETEPLDMNQVIATMAATISGFATMYMLITR